MAATLRAAHIALLVAGAGLVAWACFIVAESAFTQWAGSRALAAERAEFQETIVPSRRSPNRADRIGSHPNPVARGSVIGRFAMPRLGLSFVLLEGTDARTLDRSIGRVDDTARLGETGNVGIAGHRNTHFRKLEWVRRDDDIVLSSRDAEYRYRVEWVRLFRPSDLEVLDASHGPAVTLVTCFPFEYVGSAPLRFVVRALPDETTRARLTAAPPDTLGKK